MQTPKRTNRRIGAKSQRDEDDPNDIEVWRNLLIAVGEQNDAGCHA